MNTLEDEGLERGLLMGNRVEGNVGGFVNKGSLERRLF
jgi:hypothetical protein